MKVFFSKIVIVKKEKSDLGDIIGLAIYLFVKLFAPFTTTGTGP